MSDIVRFEEFLEEALRDPEFREEWAPPSLVPSPTG